MRRAPTSRPRTRPEGKSLAFAVADSASESLGSESTARLYARLSSAHGLPVRHYIFIVLFDGAGEAVIALGVGYEIVEVALSWVHGGFESAASGIADGARGQSSVPVGVIGRAELHIGVMERALVSAGQQFRIDDARVGVERDVFGEAVVVDAGHHRPLFGYRCLFFDDRSHNDRALHVRDFVSSYGWGI